MVQYMDGLTTEEARARSCQPRVFGPRDYSSLTSIVYAASIQNDEAPHQIATFLEAEVQRWLEDNAVASACGQGGCDLTLLVAWLAPSEALFDGVSSLSTVTDNTHTYAHMCTRALALLPFRWDRFKLFVEWLRSVFGRLDGDLVSTSGNTALRDARPGESVTSRALLQFRRVVGFSPALTEAILSIVASEREGDGGRDLQNRQVMRLAIEMLLATGIAHDVNFRSRAGGKKGCRVFA